jgi:hypothetical protein
MISFAEILNKPAEYIKAPKALPVGQYEARIDGLPEQQMLGPDKNLPALVFKVKLLRSINADEAAVLEACGDRVLSEMPMNLTMWLSGSGPWQLKVFLQDHLGIESFASLTEALPQAAGRGFIANVTHKPRRDGGEPFAVISSTAAL